jgi:lysophospholipase L1-like esterase
MLIGSSSRDIRRRNRDDSSNLMSLQKKTILMRGGLAAILFIGHFAAADIVRVACVGDSITYGYGLQESYPAKLGHWLGTNYDVRNFGVSATTLLHRGDFPYIRQPPYTNALAFEPDIVVIDFGANDSKHPGDGSIEASNAVNNWQFKSDFIGDCKEMIAAFRKTNPAAKIFICYPTPDFPGRWGINDKTIRDEIIPMIRAVADETGVKVIDLYSALAGKADLFSDTVHPNDQGAKLIAAETFRALTGKAPPEQESEPARSSVALKTEDGKSYGIFQPYVAWNNNFNGSVIGWQPGGGQAPQWTASFNFLTNGLYGYPASIRGWHYGWNPGGDNLFPRKLSGTTAIPCSFSYRCGGDHLRGDFAYDLFLRHDDKRSWPELEVMVWAGNNSTPIGKMVSANITVADGVTFDLWAGTNAPAGYYVYSFAPHGKSARLQDAGSLNVDMMVFLRLLSGREQFSMDMYLDVVEAGFEIVRGDGWVTCERFSCEAN